MVPINLNIRNMVFKMYILNIFKNHNLINELLKTKEKMWVSTEHA